MKKNIILLVLLLVNGVVYSQKSKLLLYATLEDSKHKIVNYWEIKDKPVCISLHLDTIDVKALENQSFFYSKYPSVAMDKTQLFNLGKVSVSDFKIEYVVATILLRGVYEPMTFWTSKCINNFTEVMSCLESDVYEEKRDAKIFLKVVVKTSGKRITLNEIFISMPFIEK